MDDLARLSDADVLDRLRRGGDALSREFVDEVLRRRERMTEPLARMCLDDQAWAGEGPESWAPVHATLILGSIGGPEALEALVGALERAILNDRWDLRDALPEILAAQGPAVLDRLERIVLDESENAIVRNAACEALAAATLRQPEEAGRVLSFLRRTVDLRAGDPVARELAGFALLDLARAEDRDRLTALAREAAGASPVVFAGVEEVDAAYADGGPETVQGPDWLEFYDPERIQERQAGSREDRDWLRWEKALQADEEWVAREVSSFLDLYGKALGSLAGAERERACAVARSMADFAVGDALVPPWAWDAELVDEFLAGAGAGASDAVRRFVRHCAMLGHVDREELGEIERRIEERVRSAR